MAHVLWKTHIFWNGACKYGKYKWDFHGKPLSSFHLGLQNKSEKYSKHKI